MLAIGTDGRFYPCIRYMKYALQNQRPIVIGSADTKIDDLSKNKDICALRAITRRSQSTDECFNCNVATGCSWCTAFNYDQFGDPNVRATYICKMHKARVAANYYYWNKLFKKLNLDEEFELNLSEEEMKFIKGE